jgi:hypothetical protein
MTDDRLNAEPGRFGIKGGAVTFKHVAKWWVWHPVYLVVCIGATAGSLVFGFIPAWGGAASAICTVVSTITGFKAGTRYIRETLR